MKKLSIFLRVVSVGSAVLCAVAPTRAQPEINAAQRFQSVPLPNARDYFAKAGAMLANKDKIGTDQTPIEKQKLVESNSAALQTLREGLAYEYQQTRTVLNVPAIRSNADLRSLARLLADEGQTHAARGDGERAANSFLDAMRLGIEIPRGGALSGMLVGGALESLGRAYLWKTIDQLDAASARRIARRLEIIEARRLSFAEMLRSEQVSGEVFVRDVAREINKLGPFEQKAVDDFSKWMQVEIAEARLPYIVSKQKLTVAAMEGGEEYRKVLQAQTDSTMKMLFESNKTFIHANRFLIAHFQSQNALLLVALALRAHKLEHGKYPASLTSLAPEYLEQIPSDPFALQEAAHLQSRWREIHALFDWP